MKAIELIQKLDDNQVQIFIKMVLDELNDDNISNYLTQEQKNQLKEIPEENNIDFSRFFLILLVEQENEIAKLIKEELIAMENQLEEDRKIEKTSRAGSVAIDIILVAAAIIPLIQTKIKIKKNQKGKWEFEFNKGGENLKDVLPTILKPIEILAEKIKKLSIGGFEIEGNSDSESEDDKTE